MASYLSHAERYIMFNYVLMSRHSQYYHAFSTT
jgi:hypothetical protein